MRRSTILIGQSLGLLLVFCASLPAQRFGFDAGVKGGWGLTDFPSVSSVINGTGGSDISRSSDFLIGPAAEVTIPFGFAVEVDALYHRAQYSANFAPANGSAWEIPYVAKFRFPTPLLKPYVLGGGAYRSFTDISTTVGAAHNAFVLGGGLEFKIKHLRLSGELRYLRWAAASDSYAVRGGQNQAEFLLGAMF